MTARATQKRAASRSAGGKRGIAWAAVRKLALSFPTMSEGTSYGEPAFLLNGKFFSRFNEKEQGLVVYAEEDLRDTLLAVEPETYFTTDHYRDYPYVLMRLERAKLAALRELYERAFRAKASQKLVAEYAARSAH